MSDAGPSVRLLAGFADSSAPPSSSLSGATGDGRSDLSTAAYTLLVTGRAMLVMSSQPCDNPALVEAMK